MAKKAPQPWTATQERVGNVVIKWMSAANTRIYRLSGGRLGGRFPGGAPVLLLTTIGRKSGQPRVAPLLYLEDGDRVVVVASKGGFAHSPLWFHNLQANPDCEVEIGAQKIAMRARPASAAEKQALWPKLVAMYSSYDEYQARTTRDIPVLILTKRG